MKTKATTDDRDPTKILETDLGVVLYGPTDARPYYRIIYRDRNGKRQAKSGGRDYHEAYRRVEEVHRELEMSVTPQSGRTVAELRDAFLAEMEQHWAPRTYEDSVDYLDAALASIVDVPCWEVTRELVSEAIGRGNTESMRRHYRAAVGKMLSWGYDEGYMPQPRSALVKALPKTAKADHGRAHGESHVFIEPTLIPSPDDCRAVAEAMERVGGKKHGERGWLMVALASSSGLREGELFDLRHNRLRFKQGEIRVLTQVVRLKGKGAIITPPKWGRTRTTLLSKDTIWGEPLAERLEAYVEGMGPDDIVFSAARGGWLHPSNFARDLWDPARLSCPEWDAEWTWHNLRHAFCSHLLSSWPEERAEDGTVIRHAKIAADPHDVSLAAGHRDSGVTLGMYVSATKGTTSRLAAAI